MRIAKAVPHSWTFPPRCTHTLLSISWRSMPSSSTKMGSPCTADARGCGFRISPTNGRCSVRVTHDKLQLAHRAGPHLGYESLWLKLQELLEDVWVLGGVIFDVTCL